MIQNGRVYRIPVSCLDPLYLTIDNNGKNAKGTVLFRVFAFVIKGSRDCCLDFLIQCFVWFSALSGSMFCPDAA